MSELEDITPSESVAPVFLDSSPAATPVEPPIDIEALAAAHAASRAAAVAELVALGLTEDVANTIVGP